MKIGRVFFGKGQGGNKSWESILTVFSGKYANRYDVSFSRPSAKGGYSKGNAIRYDDDAVVLIGDVYPKLALEDGLGIFRMDADGNPVARIEGEEEIPLYGDAPEPEAEAPAEDTGDWGGTEASAEQSAAEEFGDEPNSDDIPF